MRRKQMLGLGIRRLRDRPTLRSGAIIATVALTIVAAGCVVVTPPTPPPPPPPPPQISTSPGLFPPFSTGIADYVLQCTAGTPVQVSVNAPSGTTVSVAGQTAASGVFTAQVALDVGQSFTIVNQDPSQPPANYYVRCLPADFPSFTAQTPGTPQAQGYFVAQAGAEYPAIFDTNGVPIWWGTPAGPTAFAQLLADGNVAWITSNGLAEERSLDGSLVHTITTAGTCGSGCTPYTDWHDLLLLPNGDYVIAVDTTSTGDLTSWGPSYTNSEPVFDQVIEEITPAGTVVWTWDALQHISPSETAPQWQGITVSNGSYDAFHWNSIEPDGDGGFILSFRHLDAIYDIHPNATPTVQWKLGGSTRPNTEGANLTVQSDPVLNASNGDFGGQHDARLLSDGSVTIQDDGSGLSRPPRAVRYQIDTSANTATLLEQQSDSLAPSSVCCGSARKLSGGDWVMGWGGTTVVTEMTSSGVRAFLLQYPSGTLMYRATPILPGQVDPAALRAGMDAQYPPGVSTNATAPRSPGWQPDSRLP
jgi:hypothetical protein